MDMKLRAIVAKTWINDHGSLVGDDARSLEAVVSAIEEYFKPIGWAWEYMGDKHFREDRPDWSDVALRKESDPEPFQVYRKA